MGARPPRSLCSASRRTLEFGPFSPGGRCENSPAVHCRVGVCGCASPEGTAESAMSKPEAHHREMPTQEGFIALLKQHRIHRTISLGMNQPSLRDLCGSCSNPAVNCRAILASPSGRDVEPNCPNSSVFGVSPNTYPPPLSPCSGRLTVRIQSARRRLVPPRRTATAALPILDCIVRLSPFDRVHQTPTLCSAFASFWYCSTALYCWAEIRSNRG